MYLNDRVIPPAFIVDAIPGAPELRAVAEERRAELRAAQAILRTASAAFREASRGPIDEPAPRPGVTRAHLNSVLDTYAQADQDVDTATRNDQRALRTLHVHVQAGMQSERFKADHEALAAAAQTAADDALASLRRALSERDLFDRVIGAQRNTSAGGDVYGVRYHLDEITKVVNAPLLTPRTKAERTIEASTMTATQRIEAAKEAGLLP